MSRQPRWTRRRLLASGFGAAVAVAAAGIGAVELVNHGVLPGKQELDRLDGACSVPTPPLAYARPGPAYNGTFYSAARQRTVGYTIAYPPGHRPGDELPLIIMLHGYGGNHTNALVGMSPAQALAIKAGAQLEAGAQPEVGAQLEANDQPEAGAQPGARAQPEAGGQPNPPMAMVTVDGGNGYWTPHPGDDPMAMVVDELIPLCRRRGLGRPPQPIGTMGISMGGYGALLLAEKYPSLVTAVAAISPAIWTSYAQARAANPTAYASAEAFAANDAVTHAAALADHPVRVAGGYDDPFYPGVQVLAKALPQGAVVDFSRGCHTNPFFLTQEPPSLAFLAAHLTR